jgi:glycosyltransferase involved in cell wall biosynthesis
LYNDGVKKVTIIMPFLNEDREPIETVQDIYRTANPSLFDIIAIDDCSKSPIVFPHNVPVRLVRNKERMGVDWSRQHGVDLAETPFIFIIDAHMRFHHGWMDAIIQCLEREPETAWCTTCLGLGYGNMDIRKFNGKYYGATMLFVDNSATKDRPAREVLEPKWADRKDGEEYEIPCILGANYAFTKKWFQYIGGLRGLKMWGTSEPFLSIKSWLAGGKCKITTKVEIGHKFRSNAPYATGISHLVYNKIFLCRTILPEDLGLKLIQCLPRDTNFTEAMKVIDRDASMIEHHRQYYQSIFKLSIYDYCEKFQLRLP